MKKIFIIALVLLLGCLVSQADAQMVWVQPGVRVQVQIPTPNPGTIRVVPPNYQYTPPAPQYNVPTVPQCPQCAPQAPQCPQCAPRQHVMPTPPPKPNFRTPARNILWYTGIGLHRMVWYNRYWRYNRLDHLLGPTVIVQPNYPY